MDHRYAHLRTLCSHRLRCTAAPKDEFCASCSERRAMVLGEHLSRNLYACISLLQTAFRRLELNDCERNSLTQAASAVHCATVKLRGEPSERGRAEAHRALGHASSTLRQVSRAHVRSAGSCPDSPCLGRAASNAALYHRRRNPRRLTLFRTSGGPTS